MPEGIDITLFIGLVSKVILDEWRKMKDRRNGGDLHAVAGRIQKIEGNGLLSQVATLETLVSGHKSALEKLTDMIERSNSRQMKANAELHDRLTETGKEVAFICGQLSQHVKGDST